MAFGELARDVLDAQAFGREKDDEVIHQVGSLIDEMLVGAVRSLNDRLHSFLAHFLRHLVHALAEEACRVTAFRHLLVALVDKVLKLREEENRVQLILLRPTSIGAEVAHGAIGMNLDEERVVIAVFLDADEMEVIARRLTLGPQTFSRPAPEGDELRLYRLLIGFLVHEAQHQHLRGHCILYDGRHKSAHLLKIYIHSLIFIPLSLR